MFTPITYFEVLIALAYVDHRSPSGSLYQKFNAIVHIKLVGRHIKGLETSIFVDHLKFFVQHVIWTFAYT